MSLTEKYNNIFGEEISEQQKNDLDKYVIKHFNNGVAFKKELFENNELIGTTHFVATQLEVDALLVTESTASFELKYTSGTHTILEALHYTNGTLDYKRVYVSNSNNDIICMRTFKLDPSGNEIGNQTEKYHHENGDRRYLFEYNSDGSCLYIHDEKFAQNEIFGAHVGNPTYTDFTWSGFEFYEFSDPTNPDDIVV